MSFFYIKPFIGSLSAGGDHFLLAGDVPAFIGRGSPGDSSADRAVDSGLRNVPLPAGFMARLGMLVDTFADETNDSADYMD